MLILAGLKPINFSNVDEYSFGGVLKVGWKQIVSTGLFVWYTADTCSALFLC